MHSHTRYGDQIEICLSRSKKNKKWKELKQWSKSHRDGSTDGWPRDRHSTTEAAAEREIRWTTATRSRLSKSTRASLTPTRLPPTEGSNIQSHPAASKNPTPPPPKPGRSKSVPQAPAASARTEPAFRRTLPASPPSTTTTAMASPGTNKQQYRATWRQRSRHVRASGRRARRGSGRPRLRGTGPGPSRNGSPSLFQTRTTAKTCIARASRVSQGGSSRCRMCRRRAVGRYHPRRRPILEDGSDDHSVRLISSLFVS